MTYQVTVFETAEELFEADLPSSVYLVHDGGEPRLSGEGAELWSVGKLTWGMIIETAVKAVGLRVHFT